MAYRACGTVLFLDVYARFPKGEWLRPSAVSMFITL